MSILKKLAGETALYGVSTILGRSLNFLLVAVHTRAFLPDELGINVELYGYVAIFNILYTYGMETAYFRYASRENPALYYNLALSAILLSSLLFTSLLVIFATPIMNWLEYPGKESFLIWLALILAIDAIVAIPFARLRLEKKAKLFVTARIANILVNVGLNVLFLLGFKNIAEGHYLSNWQSLAQSLYNPSIGAGYIFLANLIANACFFVFLWRQFADFKFTFRPQLFKTMWVYAYPIMIMGVASMVNMRTDILLLQHLLPDGFYPDRSARTALGVYGNCYKLSVFMSLAINAFKFAAEPFFFSQAQDKSSPQTFALVMKWFIIVCVLLWVGVSLNLDAIGAFFLKKSIYREGLAVVPILLLANLFLGIYYNLSVWFKLSDKTYYGTIITFLGAGLTVVLNIVLIPQLGYMGCAITFLLSCFLMTVLCYWLGNIHYPIPYSLVSALGYIGSAGLLIWTSSQIHFTNLWVAVPYHIMLFILYVAMIVVVERNTILPKRIRERMKWL